METLPSYFDLDKYDVVDKLSTLRGKYRWDKPTGKITPNFIGFDREHPWVHMERDEVYRNCKVWHEMLFGMFNAMPPFCLDCWKVVARPKTVVDLFKCRPIMEDLSLPSKLGCCPRRNTFGLYQAYFYNGSMEEGKETEAKVREAFAMVDPEMDVYLKRFCSEFEERFGRSDRIEDKVTPEMHELASILNNLIDYPYRRERQPEILVERIMKEWVIVAMQSGDITYLELTGGRPLHLESVRY